MMEIRMSQDNKSLPFTPDGDSSVQVIPKVETPKMYQVILINDDYTPMDFVVLVLKKFFGKKEEDAIKVMLDVHQKGAGTAGVYTLEIAEMKVMQSNQFAQLNQYSTACLASTLRLASLGLSFLYSFMCLRSIACTNPHYAWFLFRFSW